MEYIKKFKWYLDENEGWKQTFRFQTNEIPKMEEILSAVINDDTIAKIERDTVGKHFEKQLMMQQTEMNLLNNDITKQQERLSRESKDYVCDMDEIDAFCTQDILRERIRSIERSYLELKCNFMTYLSNIL